MFCSYESIPLEGAGCCLWQAQPLSLPIKQAKLACLWRSHTCINLAPVNVPTGVWITVNRPTCKDWNCSDKKQIPDSNLIESKNHCVWKKDLVYNHNTVSFFHLTVKCCCPFKSLHNHVGFRAFVTDAVLVLAVFKCTSPIRLPENSHFHLFPPLFQRGNGQNFCFHTISLFFFSFPFDLWFLSGAD